MSKTKILAFSALWAMLFSCGSQGGGPPELANGSQDQHISPFDTLMIEFNSTLVEIDKLTEENFILSDKVEWVKPGEKETSSNKLKFVGKNLTKRSSPYFNASPYRGAITLKNLKNADGYVAGQIEVRFSTMSIIGEINYENYEESAAKDLDPFLANSTKTLEFAGILDHVIPNERPNNYDYYKLTLQVGDTIVVKMNARNMENFTTQITELEKSIDTTFIPKTGINEFKYVLDFRYLDRDDPYKLYIFYIKISDDARPSEPPNPYTLVVSRYKFD
jgi:hypothetical protein